MQKILSLVIAAFALLAAVPACAQEKSTFVFTAIPGQDETRLVERFSRFAKYLEDKIGVPVKYVPVKSYPAAVTAFINGDVQMAWFGGFTGVQARRAVPGSEAIAQGAEDVAFKSYVIANTATGLKPSKEFPKEIAGKTFTFGSRASTSGRVMPEYFIRQHLGNKAPEDVFSRVGFSGDHSKTIQLVQSGAYEVGVLDYTVYEVEKKAGKVDESKVGVIWESPTFPDYQFTVRGDVDAKFGAGFKDKLKAAILALEDKEMLSYFARSKFISGHERRLQADRRRGRGPETAELRADGCGCVLERATAGYGGRPVLHDIDLVDRGGRAGRHHGPLRRRQINTPQHALSALCRERRADSAGERAGRQSQCVPQCLYGTARPALCACQPAQSGLAARAVMSRRCAGCAGAGRACRQDVRQSR